LPVKVVHCTADEIRNFADFCGCDLGRDLDPYIPKTPLRPKMDRLR